MGELIKWNNEELVAFRADQVWIYNTLSQFIVTYS